MRKPQNDQNRTRVNERIRVPKVRVVDETGQQIGVMNTRAAQDYAAKRGLDLVEVAPEARPPVCRVLNYSKYKYEQERKAKLAKKNRTKIEISEIKLSVKIAGHDLETKANNARRLLDKGNHVKLTLRLKGRENSHPDLAFDILDRIAEMLADDAKIEQESTMSGSVVSMLVVPSAKKRPVETVDEVAEDVVEPSDDTSSS